MIIVDLSGIIHAEIYGGTTPENVCEEAIRFMTLNALRGYHVEYRSNYGKMFLVCDSSSWRKHAFEHYKANRDENRRESGYDWDQIYIWIDNVVKDLDEHSPFHVLKVRGAEADDIIGRLVETNGSVRDGDITLAEMVGDDTREEIMIVSADKDFIQLHKYSNVVQYSPRTKAAVTTDNPNLYLFDHICRGDKGDGVPNLYSPNDFFTIDASERGRQKGVTKKNVAVWYEYWLEHDILPLDKDGNDHNKRFKQNQKMIDLSKIPSKLKRMIDYEIDCQLKKAPVKLMGFMNYLVSNKCERLVTDINDFF